MEEGGWSKSRAVSDSSLPRHSWGAHLNSLELSNRESKTENKSVIRSWGHLSVVAIPCSVCYNFAIT